MDVEWRLGTEGNWRRSEGSSRKGKQKEKNDVRHVWRKSRVF